MLWHQNYMTVSLFKYKLRSVSILSEACEVYMARHNIEGKREECIYISIYINYKVEDVDDWGKNYIYFC